MRVGGGGSKLESWQFRIYHSFKVNTMSQDFSLGVLTTYNKSFAYLRATPVSQAGSILSHGKFNIVECSQALSLMTTLGPEGVQYSERFSILK